MLQETVIVSGKLTMVVVPMTPLAIMPNRNTSLPIHAALVLMTVFHMAGILSFHIKSIKIHDRIDRQGHSSEVSY